MADEVTEATVAGGPVRGSEASGETALAAAVTASLSHEAFEALKNSIMAELEAKLAMKEESLWRRGQVEIKKLQLEQQQVAGYVSELRERQAGLITETQKIRGGLMDIAGKFELVVTQMREVLRVFPQQQRRLSDPEHVSTVEPGPTFSPSPSVASTTASEVLRDEHRPSSEMTSVGTTTPGNDFWSADRGRMQAQSTPLAMWHPRGACSTDVSGGAAGASSSSSGAAAGLPLSERRSSQRGALADMAYDFAEDAAGPFMAGEHPSFQTPPRHGPDANATAAASWEDRDPWSASCALASDPSAAAAVAAGDAGSSLAAPPPPQSWGGLPGPCAGVVGGPSIAPAVLSLASALPAAASTGAPTTPLKRLNLSECLAQQATNERPSGGDSSISTPSKQTRPGEKSPLVFSGGRKKRTGASPPQGHSFEAPRIRVELVKEPGFVTLGIEVNEVDGTVLRVEGIDEHGLVWHHNSRQDSDASRVLVGDSIVEVNGVLGDTAAMLGECKVRQTVAFVVVRGTRQAGAGDVSASSSDAGAHASSAVEAADAGAPRVTPVAGTTPGRRLRPEAQEFVPGAAATHGGGASVPPGLDRPQGHSAVAPFAPKAVSVASCLMPSASGASWDRVEEGDEDSESQPKEVVKRLFH